MEYNLIFYCSEESLRDRSTSQIIFPYSFVSSMRIRLVVTIYHLTIMFCDKEISPLILFS